MGERDTLSGIDLSSEDGIRSFSIQIGRIHASHEVEATLIFTAGRSASHFIGGYLFKSPRRRSFDHVANDAPRAIVTRRRSRVRRSVLFPRAHRESRTRRANCPHRAVVRQLLRDAAVHASALGRGTIETAEDPRDSCSDDRSTCTTAFAGRRSIVGSIGGFPRGTYLAPRRRIADYGTLGSLLLTLSPTLSLLT